MYTHNLCITFFLLTTQFICARDIIIPNDAKNVFDAIQLADSGDTVLIQTKTVDWIPVSFNGGIEIINKDIKIKGEFTKEKVYINQTPLAFIHEVSLSPFPPSPQTSMLIIENSIVTLENLQLEEPLEVIAGFASAPILSAPIHVLSGKLNLLNCNWSGSIDTKGDLLLQDTLLNGYSYIRGRFYDVNTDTPAIKIADCSNTNIEITDSIINCDYEDSGRKVGFRSMEFLNTNNTNIKISNSHIIGGQRNNKRTIFFPIPPELGSPGISVNNCNDLNLQISNSVIRGGTGSGFNDEWLRENNDTQLFKNGNGGDGLLIQNSSVSLDSGTFIGGNGGNAYSTFNNSNDSVYITAGDGGNGIQLINSTLNYIEFNTIPGFGGIVPNHLSNNSIVSPGNNGIDILSSENSMSSIYDWSIH